MVALHEIAAYNLLGDAVDHFALDEALEWTSAENRIVTVDGKRLQRRRRNVERDAAILEALAHVGKLKLHDRFDVANRQRIERDDVVDAVQELGPERCTQRLVDGVLFGLLIALLRELADKLRADVARHDDDRVLEADHASLAVGQTTVIEHLQKDVEHIRMRFLDLVEQDDAVRPAAHGLGELAAFVVANISRRSTNEALHAELLHVLGHIDANHGLLGIEQVLGKRLCELGLANARRTEEQKRADGLVGIGKTRAVAPDGAGHSVDRLVLAYDALVQLSLEIDELFHLALHHLADRNARPCADNFGHLFLGNLFLQNGAVLLTLVEHTFGFGELLAQRRNGRIAQLGCTRKIALALGALFLDLGSIELGLDVLNVDDDVLLVLPLGLAGIEAFLRLGDIATQCFETLLAGVVGLAHERLLFNLHLRELARSRVNLFGHRVDLDAQTACRLVHEVDCLVGKEPVSNVAVRKFGSRHDGAVGDANAMVNLVLLLQSTQDGDGVLNGRLANDNGLEAALESGILLDVLAIFVERRSADGMQLASRESRLEHIARIDGAVARRARTHDGVQLVDEQDDATVGVLHLAQYGLQAVLELTAVLRARQHRSDVERDDVAVFQARRHVAVDDALCQTLDDSRLTSSRLADEHGVVLCATGEHLNGATDLLGTSDDRVELALARLLGEVRAVLVQRIELELRRLVGDTRFAAQLVVSFLDRLGRGASSVQDLAGFALIARERDE